MTGNWLLATKAMVSAEGLKSACFQGGMHRSDLCSKQ